MSHLWKLPAVGSEPETLVSYQRGELILPDIPLSEAELEAIHQKSEWDASHNLVRRIIGVQPISDGKVILATQNHLCGKFNRNYCFGYHEIVLFNPASQSMTSLLYLDYQTETWQGVEPSPLDRVYLNGILPHPTRQAVVITFRIYECINCEATDKSFLIDYSQTPPAIHEFWSVGGLSWSPDGNFLAYPSLGSCEQGNRRCELSINTLNLDNPQLSQKITTEERSLGSVDKFQIYWTNRGILYPVIIDSGMDNDQRFAYKTMFVDPATGSKDVLIEGRIFADFFLWDREANTIIGLSGGLELISLETGEILKRITNVRLAYTYPYQPAMQHYLLVIPNYAYTSQFFSDPSAIFAIDEQLNITDLKIRERIPDENILFVTS